MWKALDHTADALLMVEAPGWPELLAESVRAFSEWSCGGRTLPAPTEAHELQVEGNDVVETWVGFWRGLHRLWTVQGLLALEPEVDPSSNTTRIRARLGCVDAGALLADRGAADRDEDLLLADVKAVTWHQAEVVQTAEGSWRGTIVLDI